MRDRRALLSLLLLGCLALAGCGQAAGLGGDAAAPGGEAASTAPPSASAGKGQGGQDDVQRLRPKGRTGPARRRRRAGPDRPEPRGIGHGRRGRRAGRVRRGGAPGPFGPVTLALALAAGLSP
nr:hypothetical protein GCM10020093_028000 [Planobispora longispora]